MTPQRWLATFTHPLTLEEERFLSSWDAANPPGRLRAATFIVLMVLGCATYTSLFYLIFA